MRLSLLRAPTAPDPTCDRRRHEVTYALLPHSGDLRDVLAAGAALNTPLVAVPAPALSSAPEAPEAPEAAEAPEAPEAPGATGSAGGRLPRRASFASCSDPGFVVETVKRADDGHGFVLRGYEALGGPRTVRIDLAASWHTASRADALERDIGPVDVEGTSAVLTVGAFELVTLRLR